MDHGFGANEEASIFGFGSRGYDKLDYLGNSEDRAIPGRDMSFFRDNDLGTRVAAGFSDIKVHSVWVAIEHHVTILV